MLVVRFLGRAALVLALISVAGCLPRRPAVVPMPVLRLPATDAAAPRCLVVLLPGVRDAPSDFERNGFVALARERGVACDFAAADAHVGYFRERQVVTRLREDVIAPARARGYEQVWLAGISLGGLGSLLYTREHPDDLAGVVLIAPYLGDDDVIEGIRAAGGVRRWTPAPPAGGSGDGNEDMRAGLLGLWGWLKGYAAPDARRPPTWLVFGTEDRFAPAMELLRDVLPPERTIADDGGHDWPTWRRLWIEFLETRTLPGQG